MGCEIDFIAVGDGARSGDAIAVRWGNLNGPRNEQGIIVIDGGNCSSGEALVSRIQNDYKATYVDAVVSTHPDADHAKGLATVLEELDVGQLWLHQPWNRLDEVHELVLDGRVTPSSLESRIKEALNAAYDLEQIAVDKDIQIWEPFAEKPIVHMGATFHILGPTEDYYSSLLPQFDDVPMTKIAMSTQSKSLVLNAEGGLLESYYAWTQETLVEPTNRIRAENNSSVILLMQYEGRQILFTADAGVEALTHANERAITLGIDLRQSDFVQIPHHGSRRNVGPEILDAIVGPVLPYGTTPTKTAYVSCAASSPKHPSQKALNAFTRRGARVFATKGKSILYSWGAPVRYGWVPLTSIPIQPETSED